MWLTGVFGIATKYSEALLSVKYRIKTERGRMAGGPMYVLERGMKQKWLGVIFAILTAVSAFGIGNMVQANSISSMVNETFRITPWITGIVMAVLTAFVILGGIKSIARVCEGLVPFMAIFYVGGCIVLLIMNASTVPATLELIFKSAFTGHSMLGGFAGATMKEAIRFGVARGLFSNESGLGSAPIVAAAAQTKNPVRQALVSSTGTFWDTVVVCAMTGLVLVNSGEWAKGLKGSGNHQGRVPRSRYRGLDHSDCRFIDLCFFHDSWMVVLRGKSRRISSRTKSDQALPLAMGCGGHRRLRPFSAHGLVVCRCH